jgi:hypothetical protein
MVIKSRLCAMDPMGAISTLLTRAGRTRVAIVVGGPADWAQATGQALQDGR